MQTEQDYYNVLGITTTATLEEIKKAYLKLAFQYHPDRNQNSPAATKIMEELNEAYSVISDPVKRKAYDTPRGYRTFAPKFNKGTSVKVSSSSNTPYRDRRGVVYNEPVKDAFRFWYMVKFESKGFAQVIRFPEEELNENT
jgi:curved DNA-binding protein CbpA